MMKTDVLPSGSERQAKKNPWDRLPTGVKVASVIALPVLLNLACAKADRLFQGIKATFTPTPTLTPTPSETTQPFNKKGATAVPSPTAIAFPNFFPDGDPETALDAQRFLTRPFSVTLPTDIAGQLSPITLQIEAGKVPQEQVPAAANLIRLDFSRALFSSMPERDKEGVSVENSRWSYVTEGDEGLNGARQKMIEDLQTLSGMTKEQAEKIVDSKILPQNYDITYARDSEGNKRIKSAISRMSNVEDDRNKKTFSDPFGSRCYKYSDALDQGQARLGTLLPKEAERYNRDKMIELSLKDRLLVVSGVVRKESDVPVLIQEKLGFKVMTYEFIDVDGETKVYFTAVLDINAGSAKLTEEDILRGLRYLDQLILGENTNYFGYGPLFFSDLCGQLAPTAGETATPTPTMTFTVEVPSNTSTQTGTPRSSDTPTPPGATETGTPTETATPTGTVFTVTATPTPSETDTPLPPTITLTPVPTPSETNTPVPTPSQTRTPVPTFTFTPIPPTATSMPSNIPPSSSETAVNTPNATVVPTISPAETGAPTNTQDVSGTPISTPPFPNLIELTDENKERFTPGSGFRNINFEDLAKVADFVYELLGGEPPENVVVTVSYSRSQEIEVK